jgi:hypothetical protein
MKTAAQTLNPLQCTFIELESFPLTNIHNSVTSVREGTMPTERPSLVGEVSTTFCGSRGVA